MRITGGTARGRILRAPRGSRVRPTADKVRAAIFNILAARTAIEGKRILDLYAGTGALGLEALSRGVSSVLFVDESWESCRLVQQNLDRGGFGDRGRIRRMTLPQALRRLGAGGDRFDVVLLDPPYREGLSQRSLEALADARLVAPSGWVVAEHAREEALADRYAELACEDRRHYGSTALSLYHNAEVA